jgi:hypothetical protein
MQNPKPLLRNEHLVARYKRSQRTIDRWKRDKIIPPPDLIINDTAHWYEETLEANERERFGPKPPSPEAA